MSRLFVPVSGRYDQKCHKAVSDLKKMGAERVYISIEERFPFEKGERRDRVLSDLKSKVDFYNSNGIEAAVWIDTLGFGGALPFYNVEAAKEYTRIRSVRGEELDDAFCPMDSRFTDMMCELVEDIVRVSGTKMLMLDDELCLSVRPGIGCACHRHLAALSELVGERVELSKVPRLVFMGGPSRYRSAWLALMRDTLLDFCRKIREAVDRVSEDVRIGFCSGYTSWDLEGADAMEISRTLAGKNIPFLRFTGAPYWIAARRFERQSLQTVIESTRMQNAACTGSGIEVFTEADTYPRDRFNTPAALSECFDLATGAVEGLDRLKYVYEYTNQPHYDRGYVEAHLRNKELYDETYRAFRGKRAVGVRVYESIKKIENADLPVIEDRPFGAEDELRVESLAFSGAQAILTNHAIPTVYDGSGCFGIAFGESAKHLTEQSLEGGMVLDAKAAYILSKRGIDTGITDMDIIPNGYIERFNSGEDVLLFNTPTVARLSLREGAEVLSRFCPFTQYSDESIPASYRYENGEGQRFLVFAFVAEDLPDHSSLLRSYGRASEIAENAAWLGGELPVRCDGNPMLYCLCKEANGELAVAYVNAHPDEILSAKVVLSAPAVSVRFIGCEGRLLSEREIEIKKIAAYGFAALKITKKDLL